MVTCNLRTAKKVTRELERREIKFIHLTSADAIPEYITVLISTRGDLPLTSSSQVLMQEDFVSTTSLVDRAYELSLGKNRYKIVTVSIDPGKRIGAAFLCDDLLVRTEVFHAKKEVAEEAEVFFKSHQSHWNRIIIGAGAPEHRDQLLHHLRQISIPHLKLYLVDEYSSHGNIYLSQKLSKDESSAILISSRHGRQV